jgi:hypothetical protein
MYPISEAFRKTYPISEAFRMRLLGQVWDRRGFVRDFRGVVEIVQYCTYIEGIWMF